MTTNKVCGKGKCKFTDEFCASGDCPYDTENMLKNQQNFNTSEGNVKDDNIKSGKTKHGDFIVKYLEEGSHYKVKEINVMENVAQRNSQDLERIADTSKTIVVEKEVYEAVLRNSVKVADLEAENMQLRQFCEGFNTLNVAEENQKLKSLLKEWIHYYPIVLYEYEDTLKTKDIIELYERTREVLR